MANDERQSKRGTDGKVLCEHTPPKSPGRPPGANGIKARAARLANERLEEMLECATEIISYELDDGKPAIAQWLTDRVRPPNRLDFVQLADDQQLKTIEDVITSSEQITIRASRGEISLHQAKLLQEILGRHAQLKGFEELAKLRAEFQLLQQSSKTPAIIDKSSLPTWGRLGGTD